MGRLFWLCVAIVLVAGFAAGQGAKKLWVAEQYVDHGDRVYFVEDLETGTRCYAITGTGTSGYAISCVKK